MCPYIDENKAVLSADFEQLNRALQEQDLPQEPLIEKATREGQAIHRQRLTQDPRYKKLSDHERHTVEAEGENMRAEHKSERRERLDQAQERITQSQEAMVQEGWAHPGTTPADALCHAAQHLREMVLRTPTHEHRSPDNTLGQVTTFDATMITSLGIDSDGLVQHGMDTGNIESSRKQLEGDLRKGIPFFIPGELPHLIKVESDPTKCEALAAQGIDAFFTVEGAEHHLATLCARCVNDHHMMITPNPVWGWKVQHDDSPLHKVSFIPPGGKALPSHLDQESALKALNPHEESCQGLNPHMLQKTQEAVKTLCQTAYRLSHYMASEEVSYGVAYLGATIGYKHHDSTTVGSEERTHALYRSFGKELGEAYGHFYKCYSALMRDAQRKGLDTQHPPFSTLQEELKIPETEAPGREVETVAHVLLSQNLAEDSQNPKFKELTEGFGQGLAEGQKMSRSEQATEMVYHDMLHHMWKAAARAQRAASKGAQEAQTQMQRARTNMQEAGVAIHQTAKDLAGSCFSAPGADEEVAAPPMESAREVTTVRNGEQRTERAQTNTSLLRRARRAWVSQVDEPGTDSPIQGRS